MPTPAEVEALAAEGAARVFGPPDARNARIAALEAEVAALRAELATRPPGKPALPVVTHPMTSAGRAAAGPARGTAGSKPGTGLALAFSGPRIGR